MILFDSAPQAYTIGGLDKLICSEMEWSNIAALTHGVNAPNRITRGTLSIKCAFGGEETYLVGERKHRVADDRLLVLNCGEEYASQTESEQGAESFCLFFHPKFVDGVLRAQVMPEDHLLDTPFDEFKQPIQFVDQMYSGQSNLFARILRLRNRLRVRSKAPVSAEFLHEQFHLLLGELLATHREVAGKIKRLDRVRKVTRVELYRRLEQGREFIEGNFQRPILLADIAAAAWLSPYYLLRLFRQLYGVTPHQYLTWRRVEHASFLLETTSESITSICFATGFDSPTSFSLLFRRHKGMSPRAYRSQMNAS